MAKREENLECALEHIKKAISTIEYGSITLVIQNNLVVQVETNEKFRLK